MALRTLVPMLLTTAWLGASCPSLARAAPPTDAGPTGTLSLEPCRLEHPLGSGSVPARCGRLPVAENPDDPAGRQIELAVAVIPAVATRARPDPLFLLAGGPGQGARDAFVPSVGALAGIRRERDLVLVDQRGTGGSNRLDCDIPDAAWEAGDIGPAEFRALAEQCLADLPGDPRYYTTSVAVRDLDAVRAALGYERINLYGGSYGTRVAQHYARRYPGHTRSVILDAVVAPALAFGSSMSLDAEAALRASFARCAGDAACRARYPRLPEQFDTLRSRLRVAPVQLRLPDPVSAEWRDVEFAEAQLALAVRMLSYSDLTAALLPLLIDAAERAGNFVPLAAQSEMVSERLASMLAFGMHNAVVCSEDLPFVDRDAIDRDALERAYLGDAMLVGLDAMCAVWPAGVVDDDLKAPLSSDVPALLLSGGLDPVTPPAYADAAAAGFSDHANVVFEGQGHIQLGLDCAQSLARRFLDAGTAAGLDLACVATVKPAPFFLSFSGGEP